MVRRVPSLVLVVLLLNTSFHAQSTTTLALVLSQKVDLTAGGGAILATVPDGAGGIWAVGYGHIATTAEALPPAGGAGDGFLVHIRADGFVTHATRLGGSSWETPRALARDAAGHLYIAGSTSSRDFPVTAGAYDRTCGSDGTCNGGHEDAFVMKLDPTGRTILYATYLGGRLSDGAYGIGVDGAGVAHVVGHTPGAGFPIPPLRACETMGGAFYTRISADGSTVPLSTCMEDGRAYGIAMDAAGNAYVTGAAGPGFSPRMNALKAAFPATAGAQGFLAKFAPDGTIPFSTYIGGSKNDYATAVAVTSKGVYVTGSACSDDFPGAPPRSTPSSSGCNEAAFVTKVRLDGAFILASTLLDGSAHDIGHAMQVDPGEVVHVTGVTKSMDFPVTQDAQQIAPSGDHDTFLATIWMPNNVGGDPSYVTYLGGSTFDWGGALALDGAGGVWLGGQSMSHDFPRVNATSDANGAAFVAHYAPAVAPPPASDDVVLYARDAVSITGNWQLVSDSTAAGRTRIWNRDAGVPKMASASASPASFFELTFEAQGGVPYHVWLRMKADNDAWQNDSVFVQFSDSVNNSGTPQWRIGTTSAMTVSLEDCTGCGEHGWGWNDNGYNTPGPLVTFETAGRHTIRIQQREDGISIDQVVLSTRTYINAPPGTAKDDTTFLPPDDGGTSEPPPPPPPSDPREIVMYVANERLAGGQNWVLTSDTTAAGGARLLNPDAGRPKSASPSASGFEYFEVQFTAESGVPYHLWVRSQATSDHWMNDSVFVQFSDSVDASGSPIFRVGSDHATYVSLEDCSGCGEQGWGWNDNAYGAFAAPIYFATTGPQTIRVLRREDGISIDQIVLSAGRYLNSAPGIAKNDTTIVPK
jgi:hypothetical protein